MSGKGQKPLMRMLQAVIIAKINQVAHGKDRMIIKTLDGKNQFPGSTPRVDFAMDLPTGHAQPGRIAAQTIATRIAEEAREIPGHTLKYRLHDNIQAAADAFSAGIRH